MHPVRTSSIFFPIRKAVQCVFGFLAETQLIEMVTAQPFPDDLSFPGHLDYVVILKKFVGYLGIPHIFMGKDQGFSFINQWIHTRNIVPHRISLPLPIMMLPGHPGRLLAFLFNLLGLIELPDNVPIPIYLNQINKFLMPLSLSSASHDITTRENPVGYWCTQDFFPMLDNSAVHIDQISALVFNTGEYGIAIPAHLGLVYCRAGWIDRWILQKNLGKQHN